MHTADVSSFPTELAGSVPRTLSGIIFDCDGVILDSRRANAMFYNMVLAAFGLPPMTEKQENFTFMSTVKQALMHIVPEHLHGQIVQVCTEVVDYQRDIMPHVEMMDGFLDFITWLRHNKVRMAIHTNRASGMPFVFEKFHLEGFFDPVVTAADVAPKPDPEGVHVILKAWGVEATSVLFIGDSPIDKQTAQAAHVSFVAYGNDCPEASFAVTNYATLRTILEEQCGIS